ncbi:signal peptidase II [Candidatus Synchoanobacter obligatus]|uniref:signal peptidase II n=1 Tax=Candidatus Synchoanobacter obligatus TaxID=2919597 RepID=UPI003CC6003F
MIILVFLLTLIDQLFKWSSINNYIGHIDWGIVTWTLHLNKGMSLSIFSLAPYPLLACIQLAVLVSLYYFNMPKLSYHLCIAGGLSNLFDRIIHGAVIDYLHFHLFRWYWPAIVNLADIYLCVGMIYWFYKQYSIEKTRIIV